MGRRSLFPKICCVMSIMVSSFAIILIVRAYIYTETDWVTNSFSQLTYTNTDIEEPENTFSVVIDEEGNLDSSSTLKDKTAAISNQKGKDKKPVFVRANAVMMVYDSTGTYNITSKCGDCSLSFTTGEGWTQRADGYYYYNKILPPGKSTTPFIVKGSVKIEGAENIPDGSVVKIVVMSDTVQAVSLDSAKWTVADFYESTEVETAWRIKPKISPLLETLTDSQKKSQTYEVTLTWEGS